MIDYFQAMFALALEGEIQGLVFYGALYFFIAFLYSLIYQMRIRRWPETRGALISVEADTFGGSELSTSEPSYVLDALYSYSVEGHDYQGKRVSYWVFLVSGNGRAVLKQRAKGIKTYSDGSICVFYNPNKPAKSILIKPGVVGMLVTAVPGVMPLVFYITRWG